MKRLILALVAVFLLSLSAVSAQPVVTNSPAPVVSSSAAPVVSSTAAQTVIVQQPVVQQQADVAQQASPAVTSAVGQVFASWQPFTGGVMMWWSDTRQIWVMTNSDSRVQVYNDIWSEGMPNPNVTAPSGYYTPIRGFGAIWNLLGAGGSQLGWAMSEHVGYDTAARRVSGAEIEIQGPGNTLYGVTLNAGSSFGTWRVIRYG